MFTFEKMQIVAATCLLFVCVIHAVDREIENPPRSFNEFGERLRRSVLRPNPYRYHYNPIEPPPWNDVVEHVPDSQIDEYKPTYWSFIKAAANKSPPPPPLPKTYRQTGSVYVPVFDVDDFGRSSWHALPHRLTPEDDRRMF